MIARLPTCWDMGSVAILAQGSYSLGAVRVLSAERVQNFPLVPPARKFNLDLVRIQFLGL